MLSLEMRPAIAFMLLLPLALAACGDDGDDEVETSPPASVPQDTAPAPTVVLQPQPEPAQPLDQQVSVIAGGLLEISAAGTLFAPNHWSMASGEPVTIAVTNADTTDHNLRLAGIDGMYDTDDDALTAPSPIVPGETGELTFVPQVAGNYTFRCDFHPQSMGGQIVVE
jgi:plastocyanin